MKIDEKRAAELKERLKDAWKSGDMIQAFDREFNDFLSDREELLGALKTYGTHLVTCPKLKSDSEGEPCNCGLSKFLEGGR